MRVTSRNNLFFLSTIIILFITIRHCHARDKILKIERTKYSNCAKISKYVSTFENNEKGMGPLYNITNNVINVLVDQKEPIPEGKSLYYYYVCINYFLAIFQESQKTSFLRNYFDDRINT
jgi:hypothetical protein